MKNLFFMLLLATLLCVIACTPTAKQPKVVAPTNPQTVTVRDMYYLVKDTVQAGETVWGYAEISGNGENWRRIIEQNPFLWDQGRVSYDAKTKKWFALIKPGEVLVLDKEKVTPKFIFPRKDAVEDTTLFGPMDPVKKDVNIPFWIWYVLFALGVITFFYVRGQLWQRKQNQIWYADPITAGPPQVPDGIRDNDAYGSFRNRAAHEFPGATIEIRNLRRGRLSGQAIVHYADGKSQEKVLDNIFAYEAEVVANGQSQTRYCLQGCGNDLRAGNFMSGNKLVFTPDANIQENGTATPVPPAPAVDVKTKTTGQTSEVHNLSITTSPTPSDCVMKGLEIIEKYVSSSEVKHEVTFNLTREGLQVTMKGQNNQTKTQA